MQLDGGYRKDISGLRGISVLLVILYHLHLIKSGYLGVDVFFVISGFLITSIILRELENGQFSLKKFYLKRMRRILPALLVVLAASLIVSYFLLLPEDLHRLIASFLAALTFCSNIYFSKINSINYFLATATTMPLLHTWSLGIEEQFYIFQPLALLFLYNRRNSNMWLLIAIIASFSFSFLSYYLLRKHPIHQFYLPFPRIYEFMFGVAIAVYTSRLKKITKAAAGQVLSILGLVLILGPSLFIDTSSLIFTKIFCSCVGTSLLIIAGINKPGAGNRLLSTKILVFVGLISYSLYLWHWPIIALLSYLGSPLDTLNAFLVVLATFSLSFLTWKYVETPFRYKYKIQFKGMIVSMLATPLALGLAFFIGQNNNPSFGFNTVNSAALEITKTYYGLLKKKYGCMDSKNSSANLFYNRKCFIGFPSKKQADALLVGDSHAMAEVGAIDVFLRDSHLSAYVLIQSGSPFLLGEIKNWRANKPMNRARQIAKFIHEKKFKYIIFGGFWNYYPILPAASSIGRKPFDVFSYGFEKAIQWVISQKSIPVIVLDTPALMSIKKTCGASRISVGSCSRPLSAVLKNQGKSRSILFALKKKYPSIILIDLNKIICRGGRCLSAINDTPLYMNNGRNSHLNYTGSKLIGELYLKSFPNPFPRSLT